MAMPSINPINYVIERQYKDNIFIKNKLNSARLSKAKNLYRKDLLAHYGCVNAIEFSLDGEYLVSGKSYFYIIDNVDLLFLLLYMQSVFISFYFKRW